MEFNRQIDRFDDNGTPDDSSDDFPSDDYVYFYPPGQSPKPWWTRAWQVVFLPGGEGILGRNHIPMNSVWLYYEEIEDECSPPDRPPHPESPPAPGALVQPMVNVLIHEFYHCEPEPAEPPESGAIWPSPPKPPEQYPGDPKDGPESCGHIALHIMINQLGCDAARALIDLHALSPSDDLCEQIEAFCVFLENSYQDNKKRIDAALEPEEPGGPPRCPDLSHYSTCSDCLTWAYEGSCEHPTGLEAFVEGLLEPFNLTHHSPYSEPEQL